MNKLSLLNSLFDDLNYGLAMPSLEAPCYVPAVDVIEYKDSYELVMDLPGKTQDDIELSVKENTLSIASKETAPAEKGKNDGADDDSRYLIKERNAASFSRTFTLPRNADTQQISAQFKNGVLTVKIPCKAELAERRIQISAA